MAGFLRLEVGKNCGSTFLIILPLIIAAERTVYILTVPVFRRLYKVFGDISTVSVIEVGSFIFVSIFVLSMVFSDWTA